ncbi:MAG: hypothetical protein M1816_005096 [Peltula sp. TS41687]|nr:MAG: hypothetical protein M1816_005096 [Peltula sp. TS41687]
MLEAARKEYQEDEMQAEVLKILQPGNEFLQEVVDQFGKMRRQANKAQVACFYELKSSNVGKIVGKENRTRFLVSESSGCLDLSDATSKFSLSRNHFNMNKFGKPTEEDFETVREVVEKMAGAAHGLVLARSQSKESTPKFYHVPHIAVSRFFGRQELVEELQAFLLQPRRQDDKSNVAVLQALGGQGKSQIALELCRRFRKNCRAIGWLDATSKATIERSFERIAEELNRPALRLLKDTESKIRFVLDTMREWEEQWLMVYDNFDYPEHFPDIRTFLPDNNQGAIIFTSRNEATKVLGRLFRDPSMINDGGVELLLRDMSVEEIDSNRADAEEIVQRLGGLALAIEQAAAYIAFNHMSLPEFMSEYEKKKARVLRYTREDLWEYQKLRNGSDQNYAVSAFTTLEMSYEQIERQNETQKSYIARFLGTAAFLESSHIGSYLYETYLAEAPDPFPWLNLFRRVENHSDEEFDSDTTQASSVGTYQPVDWSASQFWSLIERLNRVSLLQSISKKPTVWFSIHPVIRDWLQLREKSRLERENILLEAINLLGVVVGSSFADIVESYTKQELLAHMEVCQFNLRYIGATKAFGCAELRYETNAFGGFYDRQEKYHRSQDLWEALWENDRKNLKETDPILLRSMANLALAFRNQQRLREAELLEVQIVKTRKKV